MPQVLIFEIFLGKYKKTLFCFFFKIVFGWKKWIFFLCGCVTTPLRIRKNYRFQRAFPDIACLKLKTKISAFVQSFRQVTSAEALRFSLVILWFGCIYFRLFFLLRGIFFFPVPVVVTSVFQRVGGVFWAFSVYPPYCSKSISRTINEIPVSWFDPNCSGWRQVNQNDGKNLTPLKLYSWWLISIVLINLMFDVDLFQTNLNWLVKEVVETF